MKFVKKVQRANAGIRIAIREFEANLLELKYGDIVEIDIKKFKKD